MVVAPHWGIFKFLLTACHPKNHFPAVPQKPAVRETSQANLPHRRLLWDRGEMILRVASREEKFKNSPVWRHHHLLPSIHIGDVRPAGHGCRCWEIGRA